MTLSSTAPATLAQPAGGAASSDQTQPVALSAQTLTQDDANSLPGNIPGVLAAVSEVRTPSQISAAGTNTFARITGV